LTRRVCFLKTQIQYLHRFPDDDIEPLYFYSHCYDNDEIMLLLPACACCLHCYCCYSISLINYKSNIILLRKKSF